jgi:anti-sigma factor RsiW
MTSDHERPSCEFSEEIIELHAMGRLTDAAARAHLESCNSCLARVARSRSFISDLKQALREFPKANLPPEKPDDENRSPSRT